MRLATSSLSVTSLLIISLLQTPNTFAAGVNAGAGTNDGTGAAATVNGNSGTPNGATPPSSTTPPAPTGNMPNKPLNQPVNPQDMNQPIDARNRQNNTNMVAPPPPANNCYTVDGQPSTTTDCSPGTNPNVR